MRVSVTLGSPGTRCQSLSAFFCSFRFIACPFVWRTICDAHSRLIFCVNSSRPNWIRISHNNVMDLLSFYLNEQSTKRDHTNKNKKKSDPDCEDGHKKGHQRSIELIYFNFRTARTTLIGFRLLLNKSTACRVPFKTNVNPIVISSRKFYEPCA